MRTESLALLVFQLLLFGDVGFHLRLSPAFEVSLTLSGDAKRSGGNILGDGAAGSGICAVADLDRSDKVGVAADEAIVADGGAELVLAVIIAGDRAAAEVAVLANIAVADVGQVADRVAACEVGVLGLDVCAQMDTVIGDGVDTDVGERTDVVVCAKM